MDPTDATEGDEECSNAGVANRASAEPEPFDGYERVADLATEIAKEFKNLTKNDDRRRDAIMTASRRRHQKALVLEQNDHDLNRQSVDNRIALEIVQIGPGVASHLQQAQRRAKQVQSLKEKIERDGLRDVLKQGDARSFQEQQAKRRLLERSLEKQIQMSQTKASLALACSKRLQTKVRRSSRGIVLVAHPSGMNAIALIESGESRLHGADRQLPGLQ